MPEPNLPPLRLSLEGNDANFDGISVPELRKMIPELPFGKRRVLTEKYDLPQFLVLLLLVRQSVFELRTRNT